MTEFYTEAIKIQYVQCYIKIIRLPLIFPTENHPCIFMTCLFDVSPLSDISLTPESTQCYADVVFLADTSQDTSQTSFEWMQNFISGVVHLLDAGRDKYQIGLAQ